MPQSYMVQKARQPLLDPVHLEDLHRSAPSQLQLSKSTCPRLSTHPSSHLPLVLLCFSTFIFQLIRSNEFYKWGSSSPSLVGSSVASQAGALFEALTNARSLGGAVDRNLGLAQESLKSFQPSLVLTGPNQRELSFLACLCHRLRCLCLTLLPLLGNLLGWGLVANPRLTSFD
jgi:hypothetical protein